jgi:putrescine transport system substrate-binding protein
MLDSSDDILPAALHYLGLDPNSTKEADLQKAADLMTKIRPSVRKFHSSEYVNGLATGEICFAVGFSGDIKQAQKRAAEAKRRESSMDSEGGSATVVRQPRHPEGRQEYSRSPRNHNYLQKPEVAARNSSFIHYATATWRPKLIDKAVLEDKTVFSDEASTAKLYTINAKDPKIERTMNRLWTRIKTGK